jgi:SAM-dependent methyltransferase
MTRARSLLLSGVDYVRRYLSPLPVAPASVPRSSPGELGLYDAVVGGWFNSSAGELCPGYPVGPQDFVADVGCGDGGNARFCASMGANTTAIDISAEALAGARELMRAEPGAVTVIQSDGNPLPLRDEFATRVICTEVLEHVDDPHAFLSELVRVGRHGALYLLSVPDPIGEEIQKHVGPADYFKKPNHVRIIQRQQFADMITAAGLVIEKRAYGGFFWAMWWSLCWPLKVDMKDPNHPVMNGWLTTWAELLKTPEGPTIKSLLDGVMPKSQIVIARKP